MGSSASAAIADSVVPMSPTACAIAQLWCSVWDAPRSQDSMCLRLDVVRPLLDIAASSVAVLLAEVGTDTTDTARLALQLAASSESLTAALNGDKREGGLSDPVADPSLFVRALVRAAFQTSNGGYRFGLTESRLDEMLEEHCCSQLSAAAALKNDSSALLEESLAAVTKEIQQLIAEPLRHDDLMGVANCLLLKQRLDCLARDAADIVSEKTRASATQQEVKSGACDEDVQPSEQFMFIEEIMDSSNSQDSPKHSADTPPLSSAEGKDEHQQRDLPSTITDGEEEEHQDMGLPTAAADDEDQDQDVGLSLSGPGVDSQQGVEEAPPERTKSQMAKSIKVEKVKGNLDTLRGPVYDLRRAISALARKDVVEETDAEEEDLERLKTELAAVDAAEKRARNFGEDLIEDMLTLDNLENLVHEDRLSRKSAYAGLESLLEDVDTVKSRLKPLRLSLEKRLKQAEERMHERRHSRKLREEDLEKENMSGNEARAGDKRRAASMNSALEKMMPDVPSKEAWRQMRLPLQFHSKEELDHYMVVAAVPNFDPAELQASVSEDMSMLTIKGLRPPSQEEVAILQQKLLSQLQLQAKRSPGRVKQLVNQMGPETYLELGEGKYGLFSQSLRLPEDVDVERIKVGYEDGYLRIMLPKGRREALRPRTARGLGSVNAPARGRFPAGMGSRPQRAWNDTYQSARAMPSVFRGSHDFYPW